jgi:hypothetical protein
MPQFQSQSTVAAVAAALVMSVASTGAAAATDTYSENFSGLSGNLIGTTNYGVIQRAALRQLRQPVVELDRGRHCDGDQRAG